MFGQNMPAIAGDRTAVDLCKHKNDYHFVQSIKWIAAECNAIWWANSPKTIE